MGMRNDDWTQEALEEWANEVEGKHWSEQAHHNNEAAAIARLAAKLMAGLHKWTPEEAAWRDFAQRQQSLAVAWKSRSEAVEASLEASRAESARLRSTVTDLLTGIGLCPIEVRDWQEHLYEREQKAKAALSAITTDAPSGRDGWRTMDSAPKDQNILLYGPSPDGPRVTEGYWCDDPHMLSSEDGSVVAEPYWVSMDGGFTAEHPPTAWQPKPAPPALSQHGDTGC